MAQRSRVSPLLRAVVMMIAAVGCVCAGLLFASRPTVALGAILLVALGLDGLQFYFNASKRPLPVITRVVYPNPSSVSETVNVRLLTMVRDGLDGQSTPIEEALPAELAARAVTRPLRASSRSERVILEYDLHPRRRGQWILGPCSLVKTSPVGLWWTRLTDRSSCQMTVWPEMVAIQIDYLVQDREGTPGQAGFFQPHQDNATIRNYNPGDDLRRVHWRSSARRGELMSRAEEPTITDRAWVGLVIPETTPSQQRELAISLAASWIVAVDKAGFSVDLASAGQLVHGSAHDHLTWLATLTDRQAGRGLPNANPEGMALLIMTQTSSAPITAESLPAPPYGFSARLTGAFGVVFSDSDADAEVVAALGWSPVRIDAAADLDGAGRRLGELVESVQLHGALL